MLLAGPRKANASGLFENRFRFPIKIFFVLKKSVRKIQRKRTCVKHTSKCVEYLKPVMLGEWLVVSAVGVISKGNGREISRTSSV